MQIALANPSQFQRVKEFFYNNLSDQQDAIYSNEFLCPLGINAAIRRNQMIVATVHGDIVGALRFYRKKTQNIISLYQFAIRVDYRGYNLLEEMLSVLSDSPIVSMCPVHSQFNQYYLKAGWQLHEQKKQFNAWMYHHK
ncbi:MAG: N-acetyltransferase [Solibacillus sp.]|uniref:N-acetyltransferase n=1 Tax=unclassified Solibacillus TaxID=2637870 RepID=UPI0030F827B6